MVSSKPGLNGSVRMVPVSPSNEYVGMSAASITKARKAVADEKLKKDPPGNVDIVLNFYGQDNILPVHSEQFPQGMLIWPMGGTEISTIYRVSQSLCHP